jgi:hypothetical protein
MKRVSLKELFKRLESTNVDTTMYGSAAGAASFEIATVDTYLAGIASTLLAGGVPSAEAVRFLQTPIPLNGSVWTTEDGKAIDLTEFPELLRAACLLAEVRISCLQGIHH